jgi:hypothetical protein
MNEDVFITGTSRCANMGNNNLNLFIGLPHTGGIIYEDYKAILFPGLRFHFANAPAAKYGVL